MSKHRPNIVGFRKEHNGKFYVGATDTDDPTYHGPQAEITFDDTWLRIVTDPYDDHVMLNVEVIPSLIQVLKKINNLKAKNS